MSLRIIINNKDASIPVDVEICLKVHNYFFNDRSEDATYPITLNLDANRHIFGYPERLSGVYLKTEYTAMIYFGPYCILHGKCVITDFSDTDIEIFLTEGQYSFWEKSQTLLPNLDLGKEEFTDIPTMMKAFTASLRGGKDYVVCPLYDPYIKNIYSDLYDPSFNYLIVTFDGTSEFKTQITPQNGVCIFAPFVRLGKLVEKVIAALGYRIKQNDLVMDSEFMDVIVVCRYNPMYPYDLRSFFKYSDRVPHIKASDFLRDIENKFGCRIFVNEMDKTISIRSLKYSEECYELNVLDTWQRHLLDKDDQHQGFIFADKENPDKYLKKYYDNNELERISGNPEQATRIESISMPVGWSDWTLIVPRMSVAADYADDNAYREALKEEFRLAVYRGYIVANGYSTPYPIATPEPISNSSGRNKLSLLYSGTGNLYDRYLQLWTSIMEQIKSEIEFTIEKTPIHLNDLQQLFIKILLIDNKKYRCYEQEIKLSMNSIVEHIVRCYPV